MPVFEKTTGGEVLLRGIDRNVSVGDRVDADDGFADYLRGRNDFEALDVQEAEFREVDKEEGEEAGDEFDVEEFLDRTPVDDVVEDIESGEVDEHLDAVGEAADRVAVDDAIGERRAELAAEEE